MTASLIKAPRRHPDGRPAPDPWLACRDGGQRVKLRRLLRTIRRERGVTQIQLAERLGVPQPMISRYEKGERQVDFVEVEAICEAVGMSFRSFCRRWESTPEDFEDE